MEGYVARVRHRATGVKGGYQFRASWLISMLEHPYKSLQVRELVRMKK